MKRLSFLTIAFLLAMYSTKAQVLPDLSIVSLEASALYDASQSSITMNISIRVTGASVGAFRPAVYVSDSPGAIGDLLDYLYVGSQPANSTRSFEEAFTYNGNAIGKYLVVRVDGRDQITESNENNNVASVLIVEPKPDLRVTGIVPDFTYDGTRSMINLDAYILLENKSVGAYRSAVYISDSPDTFDSFLGYLNVISHVANIPKKVSNSDPFIFYGNALGKYIVVKADSQNHIDEANENNNVSSRLLSRPKPDLYSSGLTGFYTNTEDRLEIKVNIQAAHADVDDYTLALYISDTPGTFDHFLGYMNANSQSANTAQMLSKFFIYNGNPAGKYVVVKVDVHDQIAEGREDNNVTSGSTVLLSSFRTTQANVAFTKKPVYPNPATHEIKLNLSNDSPVVIYDLQGRIVASKSGKAGAYSVDISSLKPGTYWVKTATGTQQFIKK